jgi:hypothetical protein
MASEEEYSRILTSIGQALRADMRGLTNEPPPKAILLQVLHLIRREQELRGMQQLSYDELPDSLRLLLQQLRSERV